MAYIATLAAGLPKESRLKMAMAKRKVTVAEEMMASVIDALNIIVWTKTKDGEKNRNRPKSLVATLNKADTDKDKPIGFKDGEAFKKAWTAAKG